MTIAAATDSYASLRAEFRAWLERELPREWRDISRGTDEERAVEIRTSWGKRLAAGGWGAPSWPVDAGGRELPPEAEIVLLEELVRAGAPEALNSNGIGIFGSILNRHGTEAQRRRFLPGMLDHSEIWCQGFSEPNAGSDLAGLQARAVLDGERLVVNGQKVWTSFARYADYCYALVRTDATGPKHAGISMVIVEMAQPGVSVRPLRTIAGGAEFAEVFFDDAIVPLDHVIGEFNAGWPMAVEALELERGLSFAERSFRLHREVERGLQLIMSEVGTVGLDPVVEQRLLDSFLDSRMLSSVVGRVLRVIETPRNVGALAALSKLHWSESHQRLLDAVVEGLGRRAGHAESAEWVGAFLYSRGETIYAGTSEIQRNTIARSMGLPSSSATAAAAVTPKVRGAGLPLEDDQLTLREGLAALLDAELTPARTDAALEHTGFDAVVWRALAASGWLELDADAAEPCSAATLLALAEIAGARLVPGPLGLTTTIVAPLLSDAGDRVAGLDAAAVLAGEQLAAFVPPDGGTPAAPRWREVVATAGRGGGLRLDGCATDVPFAVHATTLLVPVEHEGRVVVCVVPCAAEGVSVGPAHGLAPSSRVAPVTFDGVAVEPAAIVGGERCDLRERLVRLLERFMLWLDGEALGGAEEMLRQTVEYVAQRKQFGVPVGSFQAVKHLLANAYGDLELARGHAYDVARSLDAEVAGAQLGIVCSRLVCGRVYPVVAERCIQAQGGVAFTWEHRLHFWYRAALAGRHQPFPPRVLRETILAHVVPARPPAAAMLTDPSVGAAV